MRTKPLKGRGLLARAGRGLPGCQSNSHGEIGYFAPQEVLNPELATDAGDLTMHNLESDPLTAGDTPTFDEGPRSFISWCSAGRLHWW